MAERASAVAAWGVGVDPTANGDPVRPISSVLFAGRFKARVHDGWPPHAIPVERLRFE